MVIDSTAALVDALRRSKLLEPAQLEQLVRDFQKRFADPKALARHLVKVGWFTPFQMNQVLTGQGASLQFGQYRLLERLGEGGMGQVFKARHQRLNRVVALKVIRKEHLANPKTVKRFQREAQAAAALTHPNIVTLYDADQVDDSHFLAMEYVEGTDLSKLVKKSGPLPIGQACDYMRQAAIGLQHAHERGMIHRDIKPHNLLLTQGAGAGVVKILDMGLARLNPLEQTDENERSLTQDGTVMGTPDFMAPEQAKDSHNADRRADVYSLGCTLYYLLGGKLPFPGGTSMEKLLKQQLDEPRPIQELRPDVPKPLASVVRKLMAKRVEDRFQTAAEAAAALEPFCTLNGQPGSSLTPNGHDTGFGQATAISGPASGRKLVPPGSATGGPPVRRKPRRSLLLLAGGATAGLFSCCLFGFCLLGIASNAGKTNSSAKETQTTPKEPPKPTLEPLAQLLPEDTGLVLVYNMKSLLGTAVCEKYMPKFESEMSMTVQGLGIDYRKDVDRYAMVQPASGQPHKTLLIYQGSFDKDKIESRVEIGGFKAEKIGKSGGLRLFASPPTPRGDRMFLGVISSTTFVLSPDREPIVSALVNTANKRPLLRDKELEGSLTKLEAKGAKKSIWMLVSNAQPWGLPSQPLEKHSISGITGTFVLAEDVQAEFVFVGNRDAETVKKFIDGAKVGFLVMGATGNAHAMVLSQLLNKADPPLTQGKSVTLRSRLTPDDLKTIFKLP